MSEEDEGARQSHGLQRRSSYLGGAIQPRRTRILHETRKLLAEGGVEHVSMRKLAALAEVAPRTLYNAFKSKHHLIALAIREAFLEIEDRFVFTAPADSAQGTLERILAVNSGSIDLARGMKQYVAATMAIYFSHAPDPEVWDALHAIGFGYVRPWIERAAADGMLRPWVDPQTLCNRVVQAQHVVLNDWGNGRIADERFLLDLAGAVLGAAIGGFTAAGRAPIDALADEIGRTGLLPPYPRLKARAASQGGTG